MVVKLNQPVPELPVTDVEKAQIYYRDVLGCKIEWIYSGKEIGAVSNGKTAIFFRKRMEPFEPAVNWIFAQDIDAVYQTLVEAGAIITEGIEDKPWGHRQFTIKDPDGNIFYIHQDLPKD